ncbi:ribosome recycling factor [Patescibacteria group bacterium]|nr:ribosome recycling factor [Patescibacteria group bacterium]MCL5114682.1 ribosome recycling factor [Patescibacteria group bacterium]
MAEQQIEKIKKEGEAVVTALKKVYSGIRTSRPNTALVEDIRVDYYGQTLPIKQLGTVGVHPPREIDIQIWDQNAVPLIAKAIEASTLHLSANVSGNSIKINLPELSEERREELVKYVKKMTEEHKIQVRHLRDEANKGVQSSFDAGEFSEDQKFKLKEGIQKEIDKINEEIEKLLENKIKEIEE